MARSHGAQETGQEWGFGAAAWSSAKVFMLLRGGVPDVPYRVGVPRVTAVWEAVGGRGPRGWGVGPRAGQKGWEGPWSPRSGRG